MRTQKKLYPLEEIVRLVEKRGVSFGKASPYNRIRYYTKFGLLPHAKKRSFNGAPPSAAYSLEVVSKIADIEKLRRKGKSILQQRNPISENISKGNELTQKLPTSQPSLVVKYAELAAVVIFILFLFTIPLLKDQSSTQVLASTNSDSTLVRVGKTVLRPFASAELALIKILKGDEARLDPLNITNLENVAQLNSEGLKFTEAIQAEKLDSKYINGHQIGTDNPNNIPYLNQDGDLELAGNLKAKIDWSYIQNPPEFCTATCITNVTSTPGSGDITSVLAGAGLTGGGTSGSITLGINTSTVVTLNGTQTLSNKTIGASNSINAAALTAGIVAIARGGTGTSSIGGSGALVYSNGANYAFTLIGNVGECLQSSGGGSPIWAACGGGSLDVSDGTTTVLGTTNLTFTGSDFNVSGASPNATVAIDYTTSGITRSGVAEVITSAWTFSNAGSNFTGSGAGLTFLNATNISSGTINDTRLSANVSLLGSSIDLNSAEVSNVLQIASGGTGANTSQGAINAISQLTTNGDLIYHSGTNSTRLARGADGTCLTSNPTTIIWGSCAAAGTVTAPGVQSANQIAYFSADDTLTGDDDLSWDGSTLTLSGTTNINTSGTANTIIGNSSGGTITIGASSGSDLVINDANWSVTSAGVVTSANFLASVGQGLDTSSAGVLNLGSNNATLINLNTDTDASLSGTENFRIFNSAVTDSSFNLVDIFATYNSPTSVSEQYLISIANADDGITTGIPEALVNLANVDTNEAVPVGIRFFAVTGGGITTAIDMTDTDIGTGISLGTNDIVGTTAAITFSNFTVNSSGDVIGNSFAGSGSGLTTLNASNISSGTLAVTRGGTGLGSYITGDLLYANGASSLATLGIGGSGTILSSDGSAPQWVSSTAANLCSDCLIQVPLTSARNTITPTANGVLGLTVNGTSGTAATAVSIVQAQDAISLNISSSATTSNAVNLASTTITTGKLIGASFTSALSATGTTTGVQIAATLAGTDAANTYTLNGLDISDLAGSCGASVTLCRTNAINIGVYTLGNSNQTSTAINIADQNQPTAGTHYGICFDCDGTYSNFATANGITWGNDVNNITLYRPGNNIIGVPSGDSFRIGTDGSTGALQFGTSGDAQLYHSATDELSLATSDSFRLNTDGTGAKIKFGTNDDLGLYRAEENILGLYTATFTPTNGPSLSFAASATYFSTFEGNSFGLSYYRSFGSALKTSQNEQWRFGSTGLLQGFRNDYSANVGTLPGFIELQQNIGYSSATDIEVDAASGKFTRVFHFDGTSTYTDVTSPANSSKADVSFTVAADSNDIFYFTAGSTDTFEWNYDMNNGTSFADPGWGTEIVEYSSGSSAGVCNAWSTANYIPNFSMFDNGYDYITPAHVAVSCSVNGVSGKWYRITFPSHTFPTGPVTAYSFSRSLKAVGSNLLDLKVDGSSVFNIDYTGAVKTDLTVGSKNDSTPHTLQNGCNCLTNSAAGTFASASTNIDGGNSLVTFNGKVYAGTRETNDAGVYRYDETIGAPWTLVSHSTLGMIASTDSDTTNNGADQVMLTVWNGTLYAATYNGSTINRGAIYSYNGSTWSLVNSAVGTFGSETNVDGVSDMVVWNGKLYVATWETDAANFYRYDGGTTFTRVNFVSGKGVTGDTASIDKGHLVSYLGRLWWGVETSTTTTTGLARLYMWNGVHEGAVTTTDLMQINPTGGTFKTDTNIEDVTSLAVHNGQLFLGTADLTANLANIYVYTGGVVGVATAENFVKTTATAGRIDATNDTTDVDSVPVLRPYNGRLYAGSATGSSTAAVYEFNGVSAWTRINNTRGTFGAQTTVQTVSSMLEFDGTLYVGTDTSNIGSVYTWSKNSSNSYALQFDSGLGNIGAISFVGNQQAIGTNQQGTFAFTNSISTLSGAFDISEDYPTFDTNLEAAEIVSIDAEFKEHVKKASQSDKKTSYIGIVTTNPGFKLSSAAPLEGGDHYVPVALAGRVPLKVNSEAGPIEPGDLITLSSIDGVGKKAAAGNAVIGKALEGYSNTDTAAVGKISVFVQNINPTTAEGIANDTTLNGRINLDNEDNLLAHLPTGKEFRFTNGLGMVVASISDLGEAVFSKITAASADFGRIVFGELVANKQAKIAGEASLEKETTEIEIKTDKVKEDSLINLTAESDPDGILYVKEKKPGVGFVVGVRRLDQASQSQIKFTWLIVNQE